MKKRTFDYCVEDDKNSVLNTEYLRSLNKKFKESDNLRLLRNSVISVGPEFLSVDSERLGDITHIFLKTLKEKDVKATNQEQSGRCWMFAGLNIFRHTVIKLFNMENFEFSETYLNFYDRLERCNTFLEYFLKDPEKIYKIDKDKLTEFYTKAFMSDGGWWNMFVNLVKKYGVVPKSAMSETFSSVDSELMNTTLENIVISTVFEMKNNPKEKQKIKDKAIERIHNCLVMFLGNPPEKFTWFYTDKDGHSLANSSLTPASFTELIFKSLGFFIDNTGLVAEKIPEPNFSEMNTINPEDFVILSNIPARGFKFYQKYQVHNTKNIKGSSDLTFINLPIEELITHTVKSIDRMVPVWFSGDVTKGCNFFHMSLDEKLTDRSLLFGKDYPISKGDKIDSWQTSGCHAMVFMGYNKEHKGKVLNFQVENSWGYLDNETPGQDGFFCATADWFENNVMEVVIHKNFLSRKISKCLEQKPIVLDPWSAAAPALMSG